MRQINFLMTAEDDAKFCAMLLERTDTLILQRRFHISPSPVALSSFPPFGPNEIFELLNIELKPMIALTQRGMGEFSDRFLPSIKSEPFIEFNRCYTKNQVLYAGRVWSWSGYDDPYSRTRAYTSWYNSIASWIKRHYASTGRAFWVGPDAKRWLESGGKVWPPPLESALRTSLRIDQSHTLNEDGAHKLPD